MKIKQFFIAIPVAVLLLSCHQSEQVNSSEKGVSTNDVALPVQQLKNKQEASTYMLLDTVAISTAPPENVLQAGQPQTDWDKKIIKTANVTLELKNYNAFNLTIHNSTKRYGAYIAGEQQTEQDGRLENNLSIKVPVDQFEALMNALPAEDVKVIEKRITTEDVTGEVVDTKARTEAKKQVRERYLDLLKQAKNMKEILEVQAEINSIQSDIEAGTGRVDYLVHQAAYSTINLKYYQFIDGYNTPEATPSFITRMKEAFKDGASVVTGFILLIITLWPFVLSALLIWYMVKKYAPKSVSFIKKV